MNMRVECWGQQDISCFLPDLSLDAAAVAAAADDYRKVFRCKAQNWIY